MKDSTTPQPAADLDSMNDGEACRAMQREFPDWYPWRGTNHLAYARRRGVSPPLIIRGEDWVDLRDEIIRAEAK
jgi:hypothetical protein